MSANLEAWKYDLAAAQGTYGQLKSPVLLHPSTANLYKKWGLITDVVDCDYSTQEKLVGTNLNVLRTEESPVLLYIYNIVKYNNTRCECRLNGAHEFWCNKWVAY